MSFVDPAVYPLDLLVFPVLGFIGYKLFCIEKRLSWIEGRLHKGGE